MRTPSSLGFTLLASLAISIGWHTQSSVTNSFDSEVHAFALHDLAYPPVPHPVLCVGSSSFRLWPDMQSAFPNWPLLNRGFGGSQMSDLLNFFSDIVTPYHPRLILVYEGDNDLAAGHSLEDILIGFNLFLHRCKIEVPGTPVAILAVKPSPLRRSLLNTQRQLNTGLQRLANASDQVYFVDTFTPLLDSSGLPSPDYFQSDRLHLNPRGYSVWQKVIGDFLEEHRQLGLPGFDR